MNLFPPSLKKIVNMVVVSILLLSVYFIFSTSFDQFMDRQWALFKWIFLLSTLFLATSGMALERVDAKARTLQLFFHSFISALVGGILIAVSTFLYAEQEKNIQTFASYLDAITLYRFLMVFVVVMIFQKLLSKSKSPQEQ